MSDLRCTVRSSVHFIVVCFMGELAPNLVFPQFINTFDPNHLPKIKNVKCIDVIVESPISPIGDDWRKLFSTNL